MISRILRTQIFDVLESQIILSGKTIPVYHKVPDGAKKPFIEIIGQSETASKANKDTKEYNGIVPIAIRTGNLGGSGGDLIVDLIAEQIEPIIDNLELIGYTITDSDLIGGITDNRSFSNEYQTNKILNFQFNIIKN
jgi:hypothetical protein